MHHFVVVNADIDRPKGVTQLLYLQGVVANGHIPLLNVVQLLKEFKLSCGRVCREYLLDISPRLLLRFGRSDVAEHVVMDA